MDALVGEHRLDDVPPKCEQPARNVKLGAKCAKHESSRLI
jgi:hypothetical protein